MSEIRHGCDVYPYVVEKAQPLDVSQFNVPSWAKWVAADENGIVRAYAEEPIADILIWDADGLHHSLRRIDMAGIDWRRTLTAVNVEQQPMKDYRADDEITLPSPTVEVIVRRWQQLDGMTECDLAAAMVRADVRRADGFFTTLGMALEAVQSPQYNSDAEMTPVNQEHQMDTMLEIEMAFCAKRNRKR